MCRQLRSSIVHLGAAPELLSLTRTHHAERAVVDEGSIELLAVMMGSPISCYWTAIGHPIARLARLVCHTTGRSAGALSSLSELP
jgi:hypothetical protein